jgi:hypothetical protein
MAAVKVLIVPLTCLWGFLNVGTAYAGSEDEARRLLNEVVRAYKALEVYEDHGEIRIQPVEMPIPAPYGAAKPPPIEIYEDHGEIRVRPREMPDIAAGEAAKPQTLMEKVTLRFSRPNKIDLDFGSDIRFVSDGVDAMTVVAPLYSKDPSPGRLRLAMFKGTPLEWHWKCQTYHRYHGRILLSLLLEDDADKELPAILGGPPELEADRVVDGRAIKSIFVRGKIVKRSLVSSYGRKSPDIRLLIDSETKLLNQIEMEFPPLQVHLVDDDVATFRDPTGRSISVVVNTPPTGRVTWVSGRVSTDARNGKPFECVPPKGATEVEEISDLLKQFRRNRQ